MDDIGRDTLKWVAFVLSVVCGLLGAAWWAEVHGHPGWAIFFLVGILVFIGAGNLLTDEELRARLLFRARYRE